MQVPLLPKLRGHFAEFLNHSSPARLSIFYLTTCVGYGYGPYTHIARGFSRQSRITNITQLWATHHASHKKHQDLPWCRATRLHRNPISGSATSLRHPITDLQRIRPHASPPTNHPKRTATVGGSGWLVSPLRYWARTYGYGNINPLTIDYACRPRLRTRLTLGRRT